MSVTCKNYTIKKPKETMTMRELILLVIKLYQIQQAIIVDIQDLEDRVTALEP